LAETRAGSALKLDADGVYQSIGANTPLILGGAGHDVYGQIVALNVNGNNPQSATGWTSAGGATKTDDGGPEFGLFFPILVQANGNADAVRTTGGFSGTSGTTFAVKIRYVAGSTGQARIRVDGPSNISRLAGTPGALAITGETAGTFTIIRQDANGIDFLFTPNATGTHTVSAGPNQTTGTIRLLGIDVTTGSVITPWVSNTSPAPTRPAGVSTVPNYSALGYTSPRVKIRPNIGQLGIARTLWASGVDADNCCLIRTTTGNLVEAVVRASASDVVTLQSGAIGTTGIKDIEATFKSGAFSLSVTGVAGDTDATVQAIPTQTTARFGGLGGTTFPNLANMDFAMGEAA